MPDAEERGEREPLPGCEGLLRLLSAPAGPRGPPAHAPLRPGVPGLCSRPLPASPGSVSGVSPPSRLLDGARPSGDDGREPTSFPSPHRRKLKRRNTGGDFQIVSALELSSCEVQLLMNNLSVISTPPQLTLR